MGEQNISIERDIAGTLHIKVGEFDYVQIQYQHPFTDNASTRALAERIVSLLTHSAEPLSGMVVPRAQMERLPDCDTRQAEPAPAQDEREAVSSYSAPSCEDGYGFGYVDGTCIQSLRGYRDHLEAIIDSIPGEPMMPVAQHERIVAALTRPAQTASQDTISVLEAWEAIGHDTGCNPGKDELLAALRYMARLATTQNSPQPEVLAEAAMVGTEGTANTLCTPGGV